METARRVDYIGAAQATQQRTQSAEAERAPDGAVYLALNHRREHHGRIVRLRPFAP